MASVAIHDSAGRISTGFSCLVFFIVFYSCLVFLWEVDLIKRVEIVGIIVLLTV